MWHLAMVAEARYKVQSFIVARGRSQAIKLFFFDMCVTQLQHASYIKEICYSMLIDVLCATIWSIGPSSK